MYIITIYAKEGHDFERKQGGVYGKVWKEEQEGRNCAIILKFQRIKEIFKNLRPF